MMSHSEPKFVTLKGSDAIEFFQPIRLVRFRLLHSELIWSLANYPQLHDKLFEFFQMADTTMQVGEILSARCIHLENKARELLKENSELKAGIISDREKELNG